MSSPMALIETVTRIMSGIVLWHMSLKMSLQSDSIFKNQLTLGIDVQPAFKITQSSLSGICLFLFMEKSE